MEKVSKDELMKEILKMPNIMLALGEQGVYVSECFLPPNAPEPRLSENWFTLETNGWHIHLYYPSIKKAQFVERDSGSGRKSHSIQFLSADEKAILRVYFRELYKDGRADPIKIERFNHLRRKYGDKIVFTD
ncbi:MAG: ChuX/HutX family heme-like substrate-binding protein [Candidatus Bathyarchaeia archaeon]